MASNCINRGTIARGLREIVGPFDYKLIAELHNALNTRSIVARYPGCLTCRAAERLTADFSNLSSDFDEKLLERVNDLLDSDDEELDDAVCEFAKKAVEARGSTLLSSEQDRFAEVDETVVSAVVSYIEDQALEQLDQSVEKLARSVVDRRLSTLVAKPPEDLVSKVDDHLIDGAESWLDDNPDEVSPSVERLAKRVVANQAKALEEAPPACIVEAIRDRITEAVNEHIDEMTKEISSTARDVARTVIQRSTQAS